MLSLSSMQPGDTTVAASTRIVPRSSVLSAEPASPRTPLAERTNSLHGSPYSLPEREETIVYELTSRCFSAGYAGEDRPRYIWRFGYAWNENSRVGDYSKLNATAKPSSDYVLYKSDLRDVDLILVRAKFERVVRTLHLDHLQLATKQWKAALVVTALTPTRILDLVIGVLFNHYSQPPVITIWPTALMSCVGAGLRHALVINIGWEETIVTAISEYRAVMERRTIRGGRLLSTAISEMLQEEASKLDEPETIPFDLVEEVQSRFAWAASASTMPELTEHTVTVPLHSGKKLNIAFGSFSKIVHSVFLPTEATGGFGESDDHDYSIPILAYSVLRGLSKDLRAVCADRIVVDGTYSRVPGLRKVILQEMQGLIDARGWEVVKPPTSRDNFETPRQGSPVEGNSAQAPIDTSGLHDAMSTNSSNITGEVSESTAVTPAPTAAGEVASPSPSTSRSRLADALAARAVPASSRLPDDAEDYISQRAERESVKRRIQPWSGKLRGVDSLGAWTGASLAMALKVKGVCEVERDDYLKHGLRESVSQLI